MHTNINIPSSKISENQTKNNRFVEKKHQNKRFSQHFAAFCMENDNIEKVTFFKMEGRFSGRWEYENDNFRSLTLEEITTSSR